jgi:hypothetical protein
MDEMDLIYDLLDASFIRSSLVNDRLYCNKIAAGKERISRKNNREICAAESFPENAYHQPENSELNAEKKRPRGRCAARTHYAPGMSFADVTRG